MSKPLIIGGVVVCLGIAMLLWSHISAGPSKAQASTTKRPVAVSLPAPGPLVSREVAGLWPMARPSWCAAPQPWDLGVPPAKGARAVPACTIKAGRVFVGVWAAPGCTAYKPSTATYKGQGVMVDGDGSADNRWYTVCKPV